MWASMPLICPNLCSVLVVLPLLSWKHSSSMDLTMQPHLRLMHSETVPSTGLSAFIACYAKNHRLYTPASDTQMNIGFGYGLICQVSNFYCHLLLRNLRSPEGNGGYQIPHRLSFKILTCSNYTMEIYQWLGFSIAMQTVAGYVFLAVTALIMADWTLESTAG